MVARIEETADVRSLDARIDRMHQGDRRGALAFVIALWLTVLFALFTVWPLITDGGIRMVLAIAAVLVLAFNTAAIVAMLRHYNDDKSFIYGLDIKHLDEMRRRKR
jgi:archaellum biogenesis protein FlaJ (TadC family)